MMNITDLTPYAALAISLITLATLIKNGLTSGEKQLEKRLDHAEDAISEQGKRIQIVEGDMKHLPSAEAVHRLELNMASLNGHIETLKEQLKPIDALSRRLQEVLLEQAKK